MIKVINLSSAEDKALKSAFQEEANGVFFATPCEETAPGAGNPCGSTGISCGCGGGGC